MSPGPTFPGDVTERERAEWVNTVANMRVLSEASSETVEQLIGSATFLRREAGEVVVRAREGPPRLHFLITGVLRVFQERGELQYTPKILTAPAHFGELAALAGLPNQQSNLEALSPGVTAQVPFELFEARLAADPALCRAWLYSVSRQFAVTIDYLKQNIFGGLAARVANVLLTYADVFGRDTGEGWRSVGYALSYAELARQTACTRRAIINTMNAMQEAKVARQTDQGWEIQPQILLEELLPGRLSLRYSQDDHREPG